MVRFKFTIWADVRLSIVGIDRWWSPSSWTTVATVSSRRPSQCEDLFVGKRKTSPDHIYAFMLHFAEVLHQCRNSAVYEVDIREVKCLQKWYSVIALCPLGLKWNSSKRKKKYIERHFFGRRNDKNRPVLMNGYQTDFWWTFKYLIFWN